MTRTNISSLIESRTKNSSSFKNFVLNINVKNSKILPNLFFIFVFISFITLMLATLTIIQQLEDLQTQIQSFKLMYQNNNNRCNHDNSNRFHQSVDYNDFANPIISSTLNLSKEKEVRDNKKSDIITLQPYNQIILERSADRENNTIKRNASILNNVRSLSKFMINLFFDSNKRQNLSSETQTYTMTKDETSSNHGLMKWTESRARRLRRNEKDSEERQNEEKDKTQRKNEEESKKWLQIEEKSDKWRQNEDKEERISVYQQNEEKSEIQRQNEGKNKIRQQNEKKIKKRRSKKKDKKRRQNRRRNKHNRKRLSPLVATFIGGAPEVKITGNIGPWIKINNTNHNEIHQYDLKEFRLVENNMSIEIQISGLYIITVQISYFGNSINHSYWIVLNSEGSWNEEKLVKCNTACSGNEVSCYTSVVTYLKKGDRLSLQQQEKNRLINLRKGYSQIQITLLASDKRH